MKLNRFYENEIKILKAEIVALKVKVRVCKSEQKHMLRVQKRLKIVHTRIENALDWLNEKEEKV